MKGNSFAFERPIGEFIQLKSFDRLVTLIKICSDVTQNKVRIGNYLPSSFPIENGFKQEMPYRHYYLILL